MDMSLDDIITQTKGRRGGAGAGRGRGRGRGSGSGSGSGSGFRGARRTIGQRRGMGIGNSSFRTRSGNPDGVWSHDKFQEFNGVLRRGGGLANPRGGAKIVIGNLHYDVTENDLRELFAEFGTIIAATINYDQSGRSLGKADVIFQRRSSAHQAIGRYNGIPLDGRAMDIQWATATGLSAPANPRAFNRIATGRVGTRTTGSKFPGKSPGEVRGGRGGGRGRGGRSNTKTPTAEELDAELDAYVSEATSK